MNCSFCNTSQEEIDKAGGKILSAPEQEAPAICSSCIKTCTKLMGMFTKKKVIPYIKPFKFMEEGK